MEDDPTFNALPPVSEFAARDNAEEVPVPVVTPEVTCTLPVDAGARVMLPLVAVTRARSAAVAVTVRPAAAVRAVPNPVMLLPFMARAVLEKLYSSVPLT